jgi:ribosomal protein L29
MKISELRQKSKEELQGLMQEKKARLEDLKFMLHQKKVKNVKESANIKKDIARILTLLRQVPDRS